MGIRLDAKTERRLERLCRKTGYTKSYYLCMALNEFLDDQEDYSEGLAALEKKEDCLKLKDLLQLIYNKI